MPELAIQELAKNIVRINLSRASRRSRIPAHDTGPADEGADLSWFTKDLGTVDIDPFLGYLDQIAWMKDPSKYVVDCERVTAPLPEGSCDVVLALFRQFDKTRNPKLWDLRKILPGGYITPHTDPELAKGEKRLHWPIISHPEIKMQWPDSDHAVHLEPGHVYELNVHRRHIVTNPTDVSRIHIMIDYRSNLQT